MLWGLLFMAPVMGMYIRTASVSTQTFDWKEVFIVWRMCAIFFAIFLIHNHLLAPLLVYKKQHLIYFSAVAVLVASFTIYQCNTGPEDIRDRKAHLSRPEFDDGHRPPEFDDGHRPPEFDEGHHPPEFDDGHRPPEFDEDHRPSIPHSSMSQPPHKPILSHHDLVSCVVLILMLIANIGIKLYFKQRRDHDRLDELERQNLEQQLEYLKYQINPHFLMNTLNNIHALVDIDSEKAKDTIIELSKMLRFMLYEGSKPTVPLSRELAFLDDYIKLMRLRYTDKVKVSMNTPEQPCASASEAVVPPLLFITFVENAFKHGVSYRQQSFIDISIDIDDSKHLHFTCRNSKIPAHEDSHGGVGLNNVRRRLELIYGNNYKLNIDNQADIYNIDLIIPLI